jgi:methyl-accepting chemotaxis protein
MNPKVNRRKLRNFFISRETQRPLVVTHIAYLSLVTAVIIATVLSPLYFDIFSTNDLWVKHFSAKMFIILIERTAIAGLFVLILSFFHFIVLTHKLCGPLVNIGNTVRRISAKDFTRKIYLRKGDFLEKEANQINTMMEALSGSLEIIRKENLLLVEDLERSQKEFREHAVISSKLKGLQDRARRCRIQLENFQLIGDSTDNADTDRLSSVQRENQILSDFSR